MSVSDVLNGEILLGTAPDSWGVWFPVDDHQPPWARFLDEVAAAGYRYLELGPWGYLPTDTEPLREELGKRDLRLAATTLIGDLTDNSSTDDLIRQLETMQPVQQPLGASYVVLIAAMYTDLFTGKALRPPTLSETQWSSLIRNTQRIAKEATGYGLQVVFHPHAETHIETEEQISRFLAETDPGSVNLCLDTGHHRYCGGEPVTFFRENAARIPYLHLKSCKLAIRARAAEQNLSFSEAVKLGAMAEPAEGDVDFEALAKALKEKNYRGYAIVEQDMYPVAFDRPLPIATRTRNYLLKLGIG
ncbi:MAG TPA: sugar phosphate isomerase/epimerase [Chthoniobacterales bacterium]|nr:sugar phosphate isomerase/epimerase [Chthoniobacterales bacterium]